MIIIPSLSRSNFLILIYQHSIKGFRDNIIVIGGRYQLFAIEQIALSDLVGIDRV